MMRFIERFSNKGCFVDIREMINVCLVVKKKRNYVDYILNDFSDLPVNCFEAKVRFRSVLAKCLFFYFCSQYIPCEFRGSVG